MGSTKARYPTTPTLYKRGGNIWHYRFSFLGKQYTGSTHCNKKGKAQIEFAYACYGFRSINNAKIL